MNALSHARVITPDGTLDDGWVSIDEGSIVGVDHGLPSGGSVDLEGRWLLPGFVDLHMHGGGGYSVTRGNPHDVSAAVAYHRAHGTTRTLVSLVTAPAEELLTACRMIAESIEGFGTVAGIHLEGPFLSSARCGAQDPATMIEPDGELLAELLEAGQGLVRMMTLAPELSGATDLIRALVAAGVVAAVGHTDCTAEQARAAFAEGASHATHLFNGMRPMHHREPGAAGAALADSEVVCELIVDGAHVHADAVRLAAAAKGSDGVALITDAISAAGCPDGRYALGRAEVDVVEGVVRTVTGGALAGSTLTMAAALKNAVAAGIPLPRASRYASAVPARVLGLDRTVGTIEPGKCADLVVLEDDLSVVGVLSRGQVVKGHELLKPLVG